MSTSFGPGCHPSDQAASRLAGPAVSIPRAAQPPRMRLYEVETSMWGQTYTRPVSARSPAAAKYSAYLAADLDIPFRDYQRHCRVRLHAGQPADDGYGYVRRAYRVDPRLGAKVTLTGEGREWEGRVGEIVYPGTSRQYVHVAFDGMKHPVVVHPLSIVFMSDAPRIEAGTAKTEGLGAKHESLMTEAISEGQAPISSLPNPL